MSRAAELQKIRANYPQVATWDDSEFMSVFSHEGIENFIVLADDDDYNYEFYNGKFIRGYRVGLAAWVMSMHHMQAMDNPGKQFIRAIEGNYLGYWLTFGSSPWSSSINADELSEGERCDPSRLTRNGGGRDIKNLPAYIA